AEQTGELYRTAEITADGRAPRFSPDGTLIVYETGPRSAPVTRLIRADDSRSVVAELAGSGAVFSPSGRFLALVRVPVTEEITQAEAAVARAQGQAQVAARLRLAWLRMKSARVVVHDLSTRREHEVQAQGLLVASLVSLAEDGTVYFLGGAEGRRTRTDIYEVTVTAREPVIVSTVEGFKTSPVASPSGGTFLFTLTARDPLPPPPDAVRTGERDSLGGPPRGGGDQPTRFGIVDATTRTVTLVEGTSPTFSTDGQTIAYLARSGTENRLMLMPLGGSATVLLRTQDRLAAPTFSPDGRRLAYQKMTRDDWEIYLVQRDGGQETRLTREIQHDVLPRFIAPDRVLAMVGEPRHRRSYLYDLSTGRRTRLFHNNTVRTISPEYAWAVSPDGKKILIEADRDGDTVSPEHGVYLVDLDHRVTKADLIARLERNLASETALRNRAEEMYRPLAEEIRRAVAQVSVARIYEYEKALFDFDSKHISQPGHQKAAEYLHRMFSAFGYQPEYQWFEPRGAYGGRAANVIATLRGTENPDLIYVISSHYDSVAAGPGADDNSSGTAALLEAARVLAGRPLPATVVFAAFTGEESGLLGSREFVRRAREGRAKIMAVLNNDTIGWTNDARLDNTIRYTSAGIRDVQHGAALLFTRLITYDSRYHQSTDATSFVEAYGQIVGGFGSHPILGSPHYHTASDVLETINHRLIAETCKATVAAIMLLASSPSPVKDLRVVRLDATRAEVTWSPSPEQDVRMYLVEYEPSRGSPQRLRVTAPRVVLRNVTGGKVSVKAVNARGLEGWDWAWITLPTDQNGR
ncbi:MAG TPA: M20/M25/M40 family metallo-hydrolase, partial [Blastocatellia bacterium]|nr:M20/M25/M40 family metallo-hydrolase [Blastocatellia bacterium]